MNVVVTQIFVHRDLAIFHRLKMAAGSQYIDPLSKLLKRLHRPIARWASCMVSWYP